MTRVVLLTGCARGLGLHLARVFYQRGYRVVATDVDADQLNREASHAGWSDDQAICSLLDVRVESHWQRVFDDVITRWKQIDLVCNVAGVVRPAYVEHSLMDDVDLQLETNLRGTILGTRFAAQTMVRQKFGHIINIASLSGLVPAAGNSLYCASKFGVRGFSLAAAQELMGKGVALTVICPDRIQTPMLDQQLDLEEAALTFSGSRCLVVDDLERVIFNKVLPKRPVEIAVPGRRGLLARLSTLSPAITSKVLDHLRKRGLNNQRQARREHLKVHPS